jgi:hypothetical protein
MDPDAIFNNVDMNALGDVIDAFFGISPEIKAQLEKEAILEHNYLVDAGIAPRESRIYFH